VVYAKKPVMGVTIHAFVIVTRLTAAKFVVVMATLK